jgi:hypothetical protein
MHVVEKYCEGKLVSGKRQWKKEKGRDRFNSIKIVSTSYVQRQESVLGINDNKNASREVPSIL